MIKGTGVTINLRFVHSLALIYIGLSQADEGGSWSHVLYALS